MNTFITEKGTELFWEVSYSLGGSNYFTGGVDPRGYSLFVQRMKNRFVVHHNLSQPTGANRKFLLEVGRKSKKQEERANELAIEQLQAIADAFDL